MSKVVSKRLGDLITFKRGYDLPAKARKPGPYPVISSSGISGYHSNYKVEGKGVVTGRYGTLGEMYFVDGKYWPHNTALYVQDFKGNDPKYVYYLLKCLGRIRTSDKSAVPGVNRNELHEMAVPAYIDTSEQAKCRQVLEVIDKKIEINRDVNTQLEAIAKTLYSYWFEQFDFPDVNGKPYKTSGGKMVFNQVLKRSIPEAWTATPLKTLVDNKTETVSATQVNERTPYTPIDYLPMKRMSFASSLPSQEAKTSLIKYTENDILIGAMRVYFHRVCIAPFNGLTRSTTMVLRPKKMSHLPYIYQVFNEERTIAVATKLSVGTQQPYINWDKTLENYLVPYPSDASLIKRFSDIVRPLQEKVICIEKESESLRKLRDFLLPMLMNGQVTVK
ncbi:restriction endonuclease subunit S [Vibrio campbellii]|uniref:restriction endonuclease subunit S n=1 Tax=Vibrio campbellii TaxID=680 RepID=UPI004056B7FD